MGVTLGGTGKDVGKRHPTVREGVNLFQRTHRLLDQLKLVKIPKSAAAVVVSDVSSRCNSSWSTSESCSCSW